MKRTLPIDALRQPDYWLIAAVVALCILGLFMVYSASAPYTFYNELPDSFVIRNHVIRLLIGVVVAVVLARIDYRTWQRWPFPLLIVGVPLALLLVMRIANLGAAEGEARRWLFYDILGNSVQPSELAKPAIIIYIAAWLASKGDKIRDLTYGLIPFMVLLGAMTFLILVQPDLSTALLVAVTAVVMFFVAGAEIKQLAGLLAIAGVLLALVITQTDYMKGRVDGFLKAWLPETEEEAIIDEQIEYATTALVAGGFGGDGLGGSRWKDRFFTVAHTDLIMAVIGEELGLVGSLATIALFALLAYRGIKIALEAPDSFGTVLAVGLIFWLIAQAMIHAGTVSELTPVDGMPLPFVSYGGSALIVEMAAVGLLVNISKFATEEDGIENAYLAFGRRDRRPRVSSPRRR